MVLKLNGAFEKGNICPAMLVVVGSPLHVQNYQINPFS